MEDALPQGVAKAHKSLQKKLVQAPTLNNANLGTRDFGTERLTSPVTKPSGPNISRTGSLSLQPTYHGYFHFLRLLSVCISDAIEVT
jgi:hypothetical protein